MKKHKNVVYQSEVIVTNEEGELLKTTELKTVRRVTKDKFMQVYLDDFASLMQINSGAEYKVVLWIGNEMGFNTNEIVLVKAIKERISVDTEINIRTINNTITSLTEKGILLSKSRSIYTLNPKLFFKGSLEDRDICLKRVIEYKIQIDGKEKPAEEFDGSQAG